MYGRDYAFQNGKTEIAGAPSATNLPSWTESQYVVGNVTRGRKAPILVPEEVVPIEMPPRGTDYGEPIYLVGNCLNKKKRLSGNTGRLAAAAQRESE